MHTTYLAITSRLWAATLIVAAGTSQAALVYNPLAGTLPSAQGWLTFCLAPACSQSIDVNNNFLFNTQAVSPATQAGHGRLDLALNTVTGYQLDWQMQVLGESHLSNQRAGFSLLAVGSDVTQSIEIAFWNDEVWAYQHDTTNGFTKGTGAAFNTTMGMTDYSLRVQAGGYSVWANGNQLFAGLLDNYNTSGLAPYTVANTLFWGDDTSSASASVAMRTMQFGALTHHVPVPGTLWLAALGVLAGVSRRLR